MRKTLIPVFAAVLLLLAAGAANAQRLEVTGLGETSVRLRLIGHATQWWYKQVEPSPGTCTSVANGATLPSIAGLTSRTRYTFRAYSAAGCADSNAMASVTFWTTLSNWNVNNVASGVTILNIEVNPTRRPTYRIELFPPSAVTGSSNCFGNDSVHAYIPTGNGDLSDRAEVLKTERALEMLDTIKLAKITNTPVNVQVDTINSAVSNAGRTYCALTFVSF